MGIEENKTTLLGYFDEILMKGNYDAYDKYLDEDFTGYPGYGEPIAGKERHIQNYNYTRSIFSDLVIETEDMIAEGNKVVAYGTWTGTQTGELRGHPPTGKTAKWSVVGIYEFKDGKLLKGRVFSDFIRMYQQLGFYPPLPG